MVKFKVFFRTIALITVMLFSIFIWYGYTLDSKQRVEAAVPSLPDFEHESNQMFLDHVKQCVEYIHFYNEIPKVNLELLLAQAALESGWGTSRFARESKNLFGIRTYDLREPHMLPSNNPKKWGVKVFQHECDSVQHYINILNNGTKFEEYREKIDNGVTDSLQLVNTLG